MAAGDTSAASFRPVTEADIRRFTDASSFSNGRSYQRNGYISRTTLRGVTLGGLCQGSSGGPYRVEAELVPVGASAPEPIVSSDCTCPRGGFCKHVVALLLTWLAAPERFAPRRTVGELLAEKSRDELLALLTELLAERPELIERLEAALPAPAPVVAPGQGASPTLDRARLVAQVRQAFEEGEDDGGYDRYGRYGHYDRYDEYGDGSTADIAALTRLRRSGDDYAAAGRWADAQLVYTALVEGALERDEEAYYDESGEVLIFLDECVAGLIRCLEAQATLSPGDRLPGRAREAFFETLYAAWERSLLYDLPAASAVPDLIAAQATPAERAALVGRLRNALGSGAAGRPDFRHGGVRFLITLLEVDGIGDEEALEEYRAAGLWEDVAARLLALGRADEALATAREWLHTPHEVLAFAAALIARGGGEVARALDFVEDALRALTRRQDKDLAVRDADAYLTWLGQQYGLHGQPDRALELAWRRFRNQPGEQTYAAVRAAATLPGQPADRWPAERRKLLVALEQGNRWGVLVNIFLEEGEVGEALTALGELEQRPADPAIGYYGYWNLGDYRLRVAQAAERDFPDRAIAIYSQLAQAQIDQRDRKHYAQAAEYLVRARALYERQGRYEAWRDHISDLRDRHRTLRALRDELNARELE